MISLQIESLDQEGRGVARRDGKTIFIDGALPGETVECSSYRKKRNFELASLNRLVKASALRSVPRCPFFGKCGGCSLQHLDVRAQVAMKQRVIEDDLWHIGRVVPELVLPAIHGPTWGYRHRARFSVRYVAKKGGMLVGFHEKRSSYVADMTSCEVMAPQVSALIAPLRATLGRLSIRERIPQVEVSVGADGTVLVLRILQPLTEDDRAVLKAFAEQHAVRFYLQPRGPDSAHPFWPAAEADLYYTLPEFDLKLRFAPTDFTQVNHAVNRVLVRRALRLLDPQPGERVADLFCGIGNFTLAIARCGAHVIGVEGSSELAARAAANAAANRLAHATEFRVLNLFEIDQAGLGAIGPLDRMLIDPPREGAIAVVKALPENAPARIVYISCNPATLARDAAVLVHGRGYRLSAAGVVNMFPHTSHVESVAVFDKEV
ncbi:MAG: 23S rRNA (uracil(1939)-C(5))-methyltransferase RlmD [Betaproteobacteria bacterium]|nr:23S rRNA (uracil(1939)-C(5))-methyltransferase RlmD [Betaproteobacteria bacterium]